MHLREAFVIAVHSMRTAPLRTVLTGLGIVVGIAAVIALVGFVSGMRNGFNTTFGDLSRAVMISKNAPRLPGTAAAPLLESDAQALRDRAKAPDIDPESVTPLRSGTAVIRYKDKEFRALLAGTATGYLQVRNRAIAAGRMFTDQEAEEKARVIVLGSAVVGRLFDGDAAAALNSQVQVGRLTMRVIGMMAPAGQDQDLLNLTPLSSVRALFAGADRISSLGFMATSADRVPAAVQQAQAILDPLHRINNPGERDYTSQTNVAQLERISTYITLIKWFTLAVASIALLIGTLGVANMMIVTVAERTSEIGIRKAIGARSGAVLRQFLIESIMLAGLGGLIGVGAGVGLVLVGGELLPLYAPGYGTPELSWPAVFIAFGVSLVIGLFAGVYPALRAARLHPIDALRY
jgi:putative ABC transport system permease protein